MVLDAEYIDRHRQPSRRHRLFSTIIQTTLVYANQIPRPSMECNILSTHALFYTATKSSFLHPSYVFLLRTNAVVYAK